MPEPGTALRVAVAVPVYNHAKTLRAVVEGASAALKTPVCGLGVEPRVIVVDDGSDDAPLEQLRGLDVLYLRHEKNRGKGAAIMSAAGAAEAAGCTHLVTLDADGQHEPRDLKLFFSAVAAAPHDVHVGVRDFSGAHVPRSSRFGRAFSNFWVRVHTGRRVGDSQSGFRAYPVPVLTGLPLRETRYAFEVEVLVKAAWAGVALRDVRVGVHYPPHAERVSHFKAFQDNLRISWLNTRLTMRALLPWPHKRLLPRQGGDNGAGGVAPGFTVIKPLASIRGMLSSGVPPAQLALSGALGVGIGCLPLFGVQTVTVLAASAWLGRNKFVALGMNQLCMPPLVPALCIETGYFLRHGSFLTEISLQTLGRQAPQRLLEWLLGGVVLGPLLALLTAGALWCLAAYVNAQLKAVRKRV